MANNAHEPGHPPEFNRLGRKSGLALEPAFFRRDAVPAGDEFVVPVPADMIRGSPEFRRLATETAEPAGYGYSHTLD